MAALRIINRRSWYSLSEANSLGVANSPRDAHSLGAAKQAR